MNLKKYQELTGQTVSSSDENRIKAEIRRVGSMLETLLGFPLNSNDRLENLYNELGKSTVDCFCPDTGNLEDPDEVVYAYRLFPYNAKDKFLEVDPFVNLAKVKLVQGNITIKELTDCRIRPQFKQGWAKFIERCPSCFCECDCTDCVQLAVDADWVFEDCLPKELQYLWSDLVTEQADCSKDIKSESIGAHSYTRFDRNNAGDLDIGLTNVQLKVLRKYAGANSPLNKVIVP